ncbi:MAG: hypothetical protein ACFE95_02205 [Candidatus Hodarchaeota archaeon]
MDYQRNLSKILSLSLLFLLLIIEIPLIKSNTSQKTTWHVEVDDSATYLYTKVFYYYSENHEHYYKRLTAEDGQSVTLSITKGLLMTYTILNVINSEVKVKITFNENITLKEASYYGYGFPIRKTIINKNYWENWYKNWKSIEVSDDLIIREYRENDVFRNIYRVEIWNWKTGWSIYSYSKIWNDTIIFFEEELKLISSPKVLTKNMIFGGIILSGILSILLTQHSWFKIKNIKFKRKREL